MAFPIYKENMVTLPNKKIQCTLLPDSGAQTMSHADPGSHLLPFQTRETNSCLHLMVCVVTSPDHTVNMNRESRQ